MLRRLSGRLSYANVTATLALFVALGGTSYAAIKLPRNSVGSAQIRSRAVGGSEVRNGSLRSADIYKGTRRSLRGAAGATGPAGPAGPAAIKYFSAVSPTAPSRAATPRVAGILRSDPAATRWVSRRASAAAPTARQSGRPMRARPRRGGSP